MGRAYSAWMPCSVCLAFLGLAPQAVISVRGSAAPPLFETALAGSRPEYWACAALLAVLASFAVIPFTLPTKVEVDVSSARFLAVAALMFEFDIANAGVRAVTARGCEKTLSRDLTASYALTNKSFVINVAPSDRH